MPNSSETLVIDLDGTAGSVRGARREAQRFLADADRHPPVGPDTARDVLMVVGELVSNACRHAPGPCRLSVAVAPDSVDVAVEDTGPDRLGLARRRQPPGYGLWIVTRLTDGVQVRPVPGGKIVRAAVPRTAARRTGGPGAAEPVGPDSVRTDDRTGGGGEGGPVGTVLEFPRDRVAPHTSHRGTDINPGGVSESGTETGAVPQPTQGRNAAPGPDALRTGTPNQDGPAETAADRASDGGDPGPAPRFGLE